MDIENFAGSLKKFRGFVYACTNERGSLHLYNYMVTVSWVNILQHEEIGSPSTISKLKGILPDPSKEVYLKVELASVADCRKPFFTATYTLEGDGLLVLINMF